MTRPWLVSPLVSLLWLAPLPAPCAAQEPPPAPPEEVEEVEESSPTVESPAVESPAPEAEPAESGEQEVQEEGEDEGESGEEGTGEEGTGEEVERIMTPEEEEIRRKAAEKAAKNEARKEKRAAKEAEAVVKQAEKSAREARKMRERAAELVELGHAAIDDERYKDAQGQFAKVRELEGGTSFEADMGLAYLELARQNYAQAVQSAQRAVKASPDKANKAKALTFAGNATLAARPLIDGDPDRPQPGSEMFVDAALRFFLRAVELAPVEATEALAHLEQRFPGSEPEARANRLLGQYFEQVEGAETRHGRRLASTYEALLSGQPKAGTPIAVVGPIAPPKWQSGERPQLAVEEGAAARRRLAVGFVIETDGTVSSVEIISKIAPKVGAAVIETLKGWIFEPARLPDGSAVSAFWLQGVSVSPE